VLARTCLSAGLSQPQQEGGKPAEAGKSAASQKDPEGLRDIRHSREKTDVNKHCDRQGELKKAGDATRRSIAQFDDSWLKRCS